MHARTVHSLENNQRGESNATWVLVTGNSRFFALPAVASYSHDAVQRAGIRLWTDDYSSLFPLLRLTNQH
jgi:hypothetical protein